MKKQKRKENKIDDKDTFDTPLPPTHPETIPPIILPNTIAPQNPISHIYWEIAINIEKLLLTPKKNEPQHSCLWLWFSDDADNDAYYDDDAYSKLIHLSLCNAIAIAKSPPTKKNDMNPNNDYPNADAPDAVDNDADYPYYFRYYKNKKNMNPNTDDPVDDAPDDGDDDTASPESLILYSYLKRKIRRVWDNYLMVRNIL